MVDEFSKAVSGIGAKRLEFDAVMSLVNASPDGVMVVDDGGVVRFANPAAVGIFGRRGGDPLVGSEFGVPLVSLDKVDIDVPLRSGEMGVFELRITQTSWNESEASLVTVRDVTDRAHHEAQVRELNRELRLRAEAAKVLAHVGDGVVLLDQGGVVLLWNPAAEQTLGIPRSAAIGRTMTTLVPGWQQVVKDVPLVDSGAGVRPTGHSIVVEMQGVEHWLSITGVRFDGGTVYAFHDLSEEVRIANLKRDFIDTASHELRTPLTSIYGAAHTLRRTDLGLPTDVSRELVEIIWTQSQRLERITANILATRSLDNDAVDVRRARFNAVRTVNELVDEARARADGDVDIRVTDRLDDEPWFDGDEGKVRQVLGNLLQNAVKYSPGGGTIVVVVERYGDGVRFDVSDHGLGIDPEDLDQVFEKFFRSRSDEARTIEGTGLGLYIAQELAHRMGGELIVASELGQGSTFSLRLPRSIATSDEE